MPSYAFSFGECEVRVTPAGGGETIVGFAESLDITRTPELLEDGSRAFFVDRIVLASPWVDSDVETFFMNAGPFPKVFGYWTNADDGRLASAGGLDCRLITARHEGTDTRRFTFEFEAFALT